MKPKTAGYYCWNDPVWIVRRQRKIRRTYLLKRVWLFLRILWRHDYKECRMSLPLAWKVASIIHDGK